MLSTHNSRLWQLDQTISQQEMLRRLKYAHINRWFNSNKSTSQSTKTTNTVNAASAVQSLLFHKTNFGTALLIKDLLTLRLRLFTSLLASFSLFSLDLRLDPLGLIWLAALAKKALLTSHSGSCGTQ